MTRTTFVALLACVIAAGSWLIARPASANYYIEVRAGGDAGTPAPWKFVPPNPVRFRVAASGVPEGDAGYTAIANAFATWSAGAQCSQLRFAAGDTVATPDPYHGSANPNDVYVLVYWSADSGQFPSPSVGYAFSEYSTDDHHVIGATIVLNSRHFQWSASGAPGKLDIQSVVTGLIGRVLGITSDAEGNTTYPVYWLGDTRKRALGADDVAALKYLYGTGACGQVPQPRELCPAGSATCPPRITTNPGDGGVIEQPPDGSVFPWMDAGTDGGTYPHKSDDGCSCSVPGRPAPLSRILWAAPLVALVGLRLRRRRRR